MSKQHITQDDKVFIIRLFDIVEMNFGITQNMLLGRSRVRRVSDARHVCMTILRQRKLTFENIGKQFNKTYSTAIFAVKKTNNLLKTDKQIQLYMKKINNHIKTV